MKLYAVCVRAGLEINNRMYAARMTPVSKVAHLPAARRHAFGYVPAVFISKTKANKWLARLEPMNRHNLRYEVIEFDSDLIEPEV